MRCPICNYENPADAKFCANCGNRLPERRPSGSERRVVTVLFCDVKGSTTLAEKLDPEEWTEIIDGAFKVLTPPIQRYGGTVARLLGDAVLAFFGAPAAHEDDPERALRAGLEMLQATDAYRDRLSRFVFRSGLLMKPIFDRARQDPKRLVLAEGEDERVLRAVQVLVDDGLARPILVGRPDVIATRMGRLGIRLKAGEHFDVTNPESDPRYDEYWRGYHALMERKGVSPDAARTIIRTNATVIAAMMLKRGEADAMICGTFGHYQSHLGPILDIIGKAKGVLDVSALSTLILPGGTFFICDTQVTYEPTTEELVEMTVLAAEAVRRFGEMPKVAMVSHSNFGSADTPSAEKMRRAALAEAMASRAGEGRLLVYEGLSFNGDRPKTRMVIEWLGKVGDTGSALFVTGELDVAAAQATANARDVGLRTVGTLRTEDVMRHDTIFVRRDALEAVATRAGGTA